MMRALAIAAAALALTGCHNESAPANTSESQANITSVDANAMPDEANITDVPADDGDAPKDEVAAPTYTKTTTRTKTVKTETK